MDSIEQAAEAQKVAIELLIAEVSKRYATLAKANTADAINILSGADFNAILRESWGMGQMEMQFVQTMGGVLLSLPPVAPVPDELLSSLMKFEVDLYDAKLTEYAVQIKRQMAQSVIGGQSEAQFAEALSQFVKPEWAASQANDQLRRFSRTVTAEMANEEPEELWIVEGPYDDRTSDICAQAITAGAMTKEMWDSQFPGYFTGGGHFNCRHEMAPFVRERQVKKEKISD